MAKMEVMGKQVVAGKWKQLHDKLTEVRPACRGSEEEEIIYGVQSLPTRSRSGQSKTLWWRVMAERVSL